MSRLPSIDLKGTVGMDTVHNKEDTIEFPLLSAKEQARMVRKVDWHILPIVSSLYLFSFLDRSNIANAKVAGMETDLNLIGLRYNMAAAIFFVPYSFAQVPSNIILKLVRPSIWLSSIMLAWGLTMTLTSLVNTFHGLLVARFFLGLAEAGLFPGVAYYLTLWYPRAERAKRIATFLCVAIMGGASSGFLAYLIEKMEGIGGLHGWQWIFCLEVTVLIALSAFFLISDAPETASFLTETERQYLVALMRADAQGLAAHYNWKFVMQALKDYKIYFHLGIFIGFIVPVYGIALFLPTIIRELGYSATRAQLLSAPPFIAGCTSAILFGFHSDKRRLRGPYVIAGPCIALVGYILLYTETRPGAAYFGTVLAAIGVYSSVAIEIAWVTSNVGGDVKRSAAIAMMGGFGNLGGICASFVFFDPPRFHTGLGIIMGLLGLVILLSSIVMWDLNRLNKQRETMCHEHGITEDCKDVFKENGDDSPLFRYTL